MAEKAKKAVLQVKSKDVEFNIKLFSDAEQTQLQSLNQELQEGFQSFADSTLRIGKALCQMKPLLDAKRQWVAYLKTFPAFAPATAYRYMGYYEAAQKTFAQPVLKRLIAAGIDIKPTEGKPFGIFTDAVKKNPPPTGNAANNPDTVDEWVDVIQKTRKEMGKRAATHKSYNDLMKEAFRSVVQKASRVQVKEQKKFILHLFAYALNAIGETNDAHITPLRAPEEVTGEKEETGDKVI